jgi:hypothetical protein
MVDSPLIPGAGSQLVNPAQPQYSPAFLKADAEMAKLAGDKVPQSLRYQYWQTINGDQLAAIDPRAAALAYDTAIMTSPQKAFELVKQTGADPAKMYQARNAYAQQMVKQDPAKYQPMMQQWAQHNENLGRSLGLIPAANQPGQAPAANNRDAMINNIMRTIRGGESGGKYGITSFAEGKGSTASGGYQFADPTWREWARRTGGEATKYSRAKDAPPAVQDAVARNYVSDILRRNNDQPAEVFKEWYAGPKKYLTPQELAVNRGLTMDKYLANRMASYNKIAGGQAGPEQIVSEQTPQQPAANAPAEKPAEPEKSTFEKAADAVSSGLSAASDEKKPEAAPAIPTTKPTVPLPTGAIAPAQRDMYARALDAILKRNGAPAPSPAQTAKPTDVRDKTTPLTLTPVASAEPTPEKEAATPNDNQA